MGVSLTLCGEMGSGEPVRSYTWVHSLLFFPTSPAKSKTAIYSKSLLMIFMQGEQNEKRKKGRQQKGGMC